MTKGGLKWAPPTKNLKYISIGDTRYLHTIISMVWLALKCIARLLKKHQKKVGFPNFCYSSKTLLGQSILRAPQLHQKPLSLGGGGGGGGLVA